MPPWHPGAPQRVHGSRGLRGLARLNTGAKDECIPWYFKEECSGMVMVIIQAPYREQARSRHSYVKTVCKHYRTFGPSCRESSGPAWQSKGLAGPGSTYRRGTRILELGTAEHGHMTTVPRNPYSHRQQFDYSKPATVCLGKHCLLLGVAHNFQSSWVWLYPPPL